MSVNRKNEITWKIAKESKIEPASISALSGGDINDVFLVTSTSSEKFVIKINDARKFPGMFEAEKAGLEALAAPGNIDIPKALKASCIYDASYLILEYKASAKPRQDFWELFGRQLAALHRNTAKFGFPQDNYIGSLPQQNNYCDTASEFYITQRLEPQLNMAEEKGYRLKISQGFFRNVSEIIPDEPAALIHGDLWGGNYLVNSNGLPCLIDPAVAYAPREMDLAMMKLFGGLEPELFSAYGEEFPLEEGFEQREALWQLYYLLVHLNIFGTGYRSSVQKILSKYS